MNSKFAIITSTILMLVGIAFWSASRLTAIPVEAERSATPVVVALDTSTLRPAIVANEEAAREAAESIQSNNRLDLDIRLVGAAALQLAAK